MLKLVYSLFLGFLITLFIGVGIATFAASPKGPEYPATSDFSPPPESEQKAFEASQKEWQKKNESYNRNVSIAVVSLALILIAVSVWLHPRFDVITDGIMFGGVFTLIYAIILSFQANNNKFAFGVVTAGLVSVVALGYARFVKESPAQKPKAKLKKA